MVSVRESPSEICAGGKKTDLQIVLQRRTRQKQSELAGKVHQVLVSCALVVLELMALVEDRRLTRGITQSGAKERGQLHRSLVPDWIRSRGKV
jgi:hypothetical protein